MQKIFIILTLGLCSIAHAEPWFVDPILALSGSVTPLGHVKTKTYGFITHNTGVYDNAWTLTHHNDASSTQINPQLTYGLTKRIDSQLALPYSIRHQNGMESHHLGDISTTFGFQALEKKPNSLTPELRITLSEIFPTGRFASANPLSEGSGFSGVGTYETILGLNFQQQFQISETHWYRGRLCLAYLYAVPVSINGVTMYGGASTTKGRMSIGKIATADLSAELSITQHWIAVIEAYYLHQQPSNFKGSVGMTDTGSPAQIGNLEVHVLSLAPAMEYAFSEHLGLVAGVWFSVKGQNTPHFVTTVVMFRSYW